MRKLIALITQILGTSLLFALSLNLTPYGARISYEPAEGSIYTDIYIDNGFIARLEGGNSYEIKGLESDREYLLSVAYRDGENNDIDAEFATFTTANWTGEYAWYNNTDKDNGGMVRELRLRVETVHDETYGQYNQIFFEENGTEYRLFPLFNLGESVTWVDYDDESVQAVCYRLNAERFNKSLIDPSSWLLTAMEVSPTSCISYVDTKAIGITIGCTTSFNFFIDENGVRHISFLITGPSILKSFFFYSPNGESEDGAFILTDTAAFKG